MRIEISAGGLGGSLAVSDFQSDMSAFAERTEDVISSFTAVRDATYALNGGVGSLSGAVEDINARISAENQKHTDAIDVQTKTTDFLDLAVRVDEQVETLVNQNRDEFYRVNPWLRPAFVIDTQLQWYEKVYTWLGDAGEKVKEGAKEAWDWTKDSLKKLWNSAVSFYKEHKKVIDTIVIVVGAIAAIAAVVATGGAALAPLLAALGVSAGTAAAISTAVAVTAVVSTVAASTLNVVDTWAEIDNPVFNGFQMAFNIVSGISNFVYSIGNLYNTIKHIDPVKFVNANKNPVNTVPPNNTVPKTNDVPDFDNAVPTAKGNDGNYYVKGKHYDDFTQYNNASYKDYNFTPTNDTTVHYVSPDDIEGTYLYKEEYMNPDGFWTNKPNHTRAGFVDHIHSGNVNPIEVNYVNKDYYVFGGDGRHRFITYKKLNELVPIVIKNIVTKK